MQRLGRRTEQSDKLHGDTDVPQARSHGTLRSTPDHTRSGRAGRSGSPYPDGRADSWGCARASDWPLWLEGLRVPVRHDVLVRSDRNQNGCFASAVRGSSWLVAGRGRAWAIWGRDDGLGRGACPTMRGRSGVSLFVQRRALVDRARQSWGDTLTKGR